MTCQYGSIKENCVLVMLFDNARMHVCVYVFVSLLSFSFLFFFLGWGGFFFVGRVFRLRFCLINPKYDVRLDIWFVVSGDK